MFSIIIANIATGKCRKVLLNSSSTSPKPGFMAFLEGKPHVYDMNKQTFPVGGADGVALSPDSKKLYWTVISGRKLYSMHTDTLSNFTLDENTIENAVHFEGGDPTCDGSTADEEGNLYFGAFKQQSLVKRTQDGMFHLLAHDSVNFVWPDALGSLTDH